MPEVLGLADRVLVIREGRIVHDAQAEDISESQVSTWSWKDNPRERPDLQYLPLRFES